MYLAYNVLFKAFDRGFFEAFFIKKLVFSSLFFGRSQQKYLTSDINTYISYFVSIFLNICFVFIFIFFNVDIIIIFFYFTFLLKEFVSKNYKNDFLLNG